MIRVFCACPNCIVFRKDLIIKIKLRFLLVFLSSGLSMDEMCNSIDTISIISSVFELFFFLILYGGPCTDVIWYLIVSIMFLLLACILILGFNLFWVGRRDFMVRNISCLLMLVFIFCFVLLTMIAFFRRRMSRIFQYSSY